MVERRVTSLDVAAKAGVSQSAVSRVFTPGASVSSKMAERVRAAAEELGYRPNVLARSLITGRSRIIGLVVAYLDNQFYPDALQRLSNVLQEEGYHILVFLARGRGEEVDKVVGELIDYQVDGIIAASVGLSDDMFQRCKDAGIPVVLFNRGHEDASLSQITSDNFGGGRRVAEFLLAGGHRSFAHISGWSGASTGREREAGFRAGLEAEGVEPLVVVDGLYDRDEAAKAVRQIYEDGHRPEALFVGNDHMAFAVLDALRSDMGLSVPGDVSVVGYDDVPIAAWAAYDLTTVRQPSGRMVEATVATLLEQIEQPDTPAKRVAIEGPLIVRGTARKPDNWTTD